MSVDFKKLLSKPAGEIKRPPPLPAGDYPCYCKGFEHIVSRNEKKTPGIAFQLIIQGWPDDVDEGDKEGITIESRPITFNQYYTEDSLWRLKELVVDAFGIDMDGKGINLEEALAECPGTQVVANVIQQMNDKGETTYRVDKLGPAS